MVQTLLKQQSDTAFQIEIYSHPVEQDTQWSLHAMATVCTNKDKVLPGLDIAETQAKYTNALSTDTFYQELTGNGLNYGPIFQGVQQLFTRDDSSFAHIIVNDDTTTSTIHPAILDSCLQAMGTVLPTPKANHTYLPVGFNQVKVYQSNTTTCWIQTQVDHQSSNARNVSGNLIAYDKFGECVFKVEGVHYRQASLAQLNQHESKQWLYEIQWEQQALTEDQHETLFDSSQHWLFFADQSNHCASLIAQLKQQEIDCNIITADQSIPQLFETLTDHPITHIVYTRGLDSHAIPDTDLKCLTQDQKIQCNGLLQLIQALNQLQQDSPPRLVVLTQQAIQIGQALVDVNATQTSLWGFHRTVVQEHPELHSVCIDVDETSLRGSMLLQDLATISDEHQIAYRSGQRYVARLGRYQSIFVFLIDSSREYLSLTNQ